MLMSACVSGTNLSRALNLHHSGSDLQAVIKGSSSGLQGARQTCLFESFSEARQTSLHELFYKTSRFFQELKSSSIMSKNP